MKDSSKMKRRKFLGGSAKTCVSIGAAWGILGLLGEVAYAAQGKNGGKNLEKNLGKNAGANNANLAQITDYRTLGSAQTPLRVSNLGFGCMGLNYHRSVKLEKKSAIALIHAAIERGVNFFDTAEIYGPLSNESLVGEALRAYGGGKNEIFVATKFGFGLENGRVTTTKPDSSPRNIRRAVEGSLKRLGIESIALFYQHRFDPQTPIETLSETIKALMKEGKIQRFGLCEVNEEIVRKIHAIVPVSAIQSEYHLMWRSVEAKILPLCEELGIGFVPYSPINRGFLSGMINEHTRFDPDNDNRVNLPRFQKDAIAENLAIIEALRSFGEPRGYTPAQVAQSWLLAKKPYIVPITGTSKLSHLEENLRAAQISLSPSEVGEIERLVGGVKIVGERYNQKEQAQVR